MEDNQKNNPQPPSVNLNNEPNRPPHEPQKRPDLPPERIPEGVPEVTPASEPASQPETPATTGDVIGPEIDLPGANPGIELPPKPHGPERLDSSEMNNTETNPNLYRLTYGVQGHRMESKRRSSGVLTYAIIMTVAFALCFTMLLGVIMYENGLINIGSTRTIYVRNISNDTGVLTIPEIAGKVRPSVVCITVEYEGSPGTGVGTGIIMSADGYIATNYHVIENGTNIIVITDSAEYVAQVIGYDALSDLAVVKINANGLVPAEFGDSNELIVGELAVAIGTPGGLDYAGTVTDGIISAIDRNVKIYDNTGVMIKKMTLIQTNATVNPGNSGGPLVNEYGKVVGVVSMKLANNYDGIGFAIPINGALIILNEIVDTGASGSSSEVVQKRAIIGVTAGGVSEGDDYILDDGTAVRADITGVIITSVNADYDASEKLVPGDIIVKVDGRSVFSVYEVMSIVNNKFAGDSITVYYYRDGVYHTVAVTLGVEE